jgi:hypothetical protein
MHPQEIQMRKGRSAMWFQLSRVVQIGLGLLAFAGSCTPTDRHPVELLDAPPAPASGEGNLVLGADGGLYLSWVEPESTAHVFKFSRWDGNRWSVPLEIARGGDWFVNWADLPGMTALRDGTTLFAHWLAKSGESTYAYDVHVTRSVDGGRTWGPSFIPYRDSTQSEHGFVAWTPLFRDRAGLTWLDGRNTGGGEGHGGAIQLRFATLTAGGSIAEETLLDDRVCDCCPTDLVASGDSTLFVVYRDRSDTEIRDIRIARYDGTSWSPGQLVHADGWKLAGCPVNGPQVAAEGPLIAVAWFTVDAEDHGHVRVAFSRNETSFGTPIEVAGPDPLGRVDLVLRPSGTAWIAWLEAVKNGLAEVRVRSVDATGALGKPIVVATSGSRSSGIPRLACRGNDLFIAWTSAPGPDREATANRVLTARIRGI